MPRQISSLATVLEAYGPFSKRKRMHQFAAVEQDTRPSGLGSEYPLCLAIFFKGEFRLEQKPGSSLN